MVLRFAALYWRIRLREAAMFGDGVNFVDAHVGRRLAVRRLELSLSPEALAAASGVTIAELRAFEAGRARISPQVMFTLTEVLEAPVAYFYDGLLVLRSH